ncbi:hypothetical protein C6P42_002557, partial [Pichia californica]
MQIPAIASALSSSSYNLSKSSNSNNNLSNNNHNSNNILSKPFDILIPNFEINHDFFLEYKNPNIILETYSNGIILVSNNLILFYNYSLQLIKIIKFNSIKKFNYGKIISNLLILISTNNKLILIDSLSLTYLSSFQLNYHFTCFKNVINLNNTNLINNNIILSLYTNSSCSQLILINIRENKILKYSPLIYLQFWPIDILSIDSNFFYFFNSFGEYQIFNFKTENLNNLPFKLPNLIDLNYGKLKNIQLFNNNSKCFIILQEFGWLIYKFNSTNKNNSLKNLQLIISSPLSSSFEKLIQIKNNSFILMSDRNLTLISGNNIHLINSNNNENILLDIFLNKKNSNLLGLFNNNKLMELIDFQYWNENIIQNNKEMINNSNNNNNNNKIIYTD